MTTVEAIKAKHSFHLSEFHKFDAEGQSVSANISLGLLLGLQEALSAMGEYETYSECAARTRVAQCKSLKMKVA